jgi:hypothetical protein
LLTSVTSHLLIDLLCELVDGLLLMLVSFPL